MCVDAGRADGGQRPAQRQQVQRCHLSSGGPPCPARADGSVQCNTFLRAGQPALGELPQCRLGEVPLSFPLCKVPLLLLLLFALLATFCTNERTAVCFFLRCCVSPAASCS